MSATILEITDNEPTFFVSGRTLNEALLSLNTNYEDEKAIFELVRKHDCSGVNQKFNIKDNLWVIFA